MTTAYRYSDAVVVASMRYVQMPILGIAGYFVCAEIMLAREIIGALVIIASCLVIEWRELARARSINRGSRANPMKCLFFCENPGKPARLTA